MRTFLWTGYAASPKLLRHGCSMNPRRPAARRRIAAARPAPGRPARAGGWFRNGSGRFRNARPVYSHQGITFRRRGGRLPARRHCARRADRRQGGSSWKRGRQGENPRGRDKPIDFPDYPEADPLECPEEGWEWKGTGDVESNDGSWVDLVTGSSLRQDLNHPGDIKLHWDYNDKGTGTKWRMYPDGTVQQKA